MSAAAIGALPTARVAVRVDERAGQARQLPLGAKPGVQRQFAAVEVDRRVAIERGELQHTIDHFGRILVHDAERIARVILETPGRQRELQMMHGAQTPAPGDQLVGDHFHIQRMLAESDHWIPRSRA